MMQTEQPSCEILENFTCLCIVPLTFTDNDILSVNPERLSHFVYNVYIYKHYRLAQNLTLSWTH